jgi:SSS family transporter
MRMIDVIILTVYAAVIVSIGMAASRRRQADGDFFLAGRSMHWLPIGLSIALTAFSAINYTAFSGEVFGHGLYVALSLPVFIFVAVPVIRVIMPFYHQLGVTSAYEYLEKRFDPRVRTLASGLFILWRTFWMATALYVPAKLLVLLTGWNIYTVILLTGAVVTAYSAAGGIRAVMWTDVFQFLVLVGGLLIILYLAASRMPEGFAEIFRISAAGGLMKPFYPFDPAIFSLDPRVRITLWSAWIGTFVAFMSRYGVDQVVVQRYFTARSLRTAQIAFHLNYAAAILALLTLALLGFAMYAHAIAAGASVIDPDQPMLWFTSLIRSLPEGATGLVVVGLTAATMSSMDSGINSCCAAFVTDFYRRFYPDRRFHTPGFNRRMSVLFGLIATLAAMSVGQLGTIFEIANKIINGFGSPLLAIFLLGMFSTAASSRGMLIGGILGAAWSAGVSFGVKGMALHYYAVVNFAGTWLLCYGISRIDIHFFGSRPSPDQLRWTWAALRGHKVNLR